MKIAFERFVLFIMWMLLLNVIVSAVQLTVPATCPPEYRIDSSLNLCRRGCVVKTPTCPPGYKLGRCRRYFNYYVC